MPFPIIRRNTGKVMVVDPVSTETFSLGVSLAAISLWHLFISPAVYGRSDVAQNTSTTVIFASVDRSSMLSSTVSNKYRY